MYLPIITLIFVCVYLAWTGWSYQITREVGSNTKAELTHLGMLVLFLWVCASIIGFAWMVF